MATSMLVRLRAAVWRCENTLSRLLNHPDPTLHGFHPALSLAGVTANDTTRSNNGQSVIDSLFRDSILWAAVPKFRRSIEKNKTRRYSEAYMKKYASPKKNIKTCLECGHHHEVHTICGNCYEKVKEETSLMKDTMDKGDRLYNAPKSEVVYVYEQEDKNEHQDKYVVQMDKNRPSWFPKNLLQKGSDT